MKKLLPLILLLTVTGCQGGILSLATPATRDKEAAGDTIFGDVASFQGDNLTIEESESGVVAGQYALVSDVVDDQTVWTV